MARSLLDSVNSIFEKAGYSTDPTALSQLAAEGASSAVVR